MVEMAPREKPDTYIDAFSSDEEVRKLKVSTLSPGQFSQEVLSHH